MSPFWDVKARWRNQAAPTPPLALRCLCHRVSASALAVSGPVVARLRRSGVAAAALDGVNMGALALMAAVTWRLGRTALVDGWTVPHSRGRVLSLRYRVNSAWLVHSGAAAGLTLGG